jgi:uncharacterized membrane protein (UPF0127 family)
MPQNRVCIKGSCFDVELAVTLEQKAEGLMHRTQLDEYKGMLFIFEEEIPHQFWMRDMLISLDMIWINSSEEVVHIATAHPCEGKCQIIEPSKNALYVLEITAGTAGKIGLQIGDEVVFHNIFK